jgi:hypothetical protein
MLAHKTPQKQVQENLQEFLGAQDSSDLAAW